MDLTIWDITLFVFLNTVLAIVLSTVLRRILPIKTSWIRISFALLPSVFITMILSFRVSSGYIDPGQYAGPNEQGDCYPCGLAAMLPLMFSLYIALGCGFLGGIVGILLGRTRKLP